MKPGNASQRDASTRSPYFGVDADAAVDALDAPARDEDVGPALVGRRVDVGVVESSIGESARRTRAEVYHAAWYRSRDVMLPSPIGLRGAATGAVPAASGIPR